MQKIIATDKMKQLLRVSASANPQEALPATAELAKAFEQVIRQGVLAGDIRDNIFDIVDVTQGETTDFPLDFLAPGTEDEYVAYTMPNHGYIPQRNIEGDYVKVPTYAIGAAIDWLLKYARDARWDVIGRAMEVMEAQFTKKLNDDGWHTIISAAVDRNIIVLDSDAAAGQFTKRLVSLAKVVMRRNGGGNSTSLNRKKLTDLYLSPEAMEDIRNWNVDQVDETTRREIFLAEDGKINRIFGINLHDLDELGEGQEYQTFYTSQLSGTLPSGDVEILVGLDLSTRLTFVQPVAEFPQIFADDVLHRQRRGGVYGWAEQGFACLDGRNVILLSI